MSETQVFGDDSTDFKSNLSNEITDAYLAVRNLQYEDSVSEKLFEWCKSVAYGDNGLGDAQNEADSPSTSDHDAGSSDFPTITEENDDGESYILPDVDYSASDAEIVEEIQWLLSTHVGASKAPAPAGNSGSEEPSDDSEDDDNEQNSVSDNDPLTDLPGVGSKLAGDIRESFDSDPELLNAVLESIDRVESCEIDDSLEVTQRFNSLDKVVMSDDVSLEDLSDDQRREIAA